MSVQEIINNINNNPNQDNTLKILELLYWIRRFTPVNNRPNIGLPPDYQSSIDAFNDAIIALGGDKYIYERPDLFTTKTTILNNSSVNLLEDLTSLLDFSESNSLDVESNDNPFESNEDFLKASAPNGIIDSSNEVINKEIQKYYQDLNDDNLNDDNLKLLNLFESSDDNETIFNPNANQLVGKFNPNEVFNIRLTADKNLKKRYDKQELKYDPNKPWWELNLKNLGAGYAPSTMSKEDTTAWNNANSRLEELSNSSDRAKQLLQNDRYRNELLKRHEGNLDGITDADLTTEIEGIDTELTKQDLTNASKYALAGKMFNQTMDLASDSINNDIQLDKTSEAVNYGLGQTSDALMSSGNQYAMMAGAALKTALLIGNSIHKKVDNFGRNKKLMADMGGSYSHLDNLTLEAEANQGTFSGFSKIGDKRKLGEEAAKAQNYLALILKNKNDYLDRSNNLFNEVANDIRLSGGPYLLRMSAKKGGILERINKIISNVNDSKNIELIVDQTKEEIPELFKSGGSINIIASENNEDTWEFIPSPKIEWEFKSAPDDFVSKFQHGGTVNLIPEGALHARKHNLEQIDESLKGNITSKGIPVISEDERGEIQLHAEIEHSEIIFRLEVTEKIEEARKKYESEDLKQSEKDLIAIEIGKLLTQEILYNTDDRTNLINKE